MPVEQFPRTAQVAVFEGTLHQVHVGRVGVAPGEQLLGFGAAGLVFGMGSL